MLFYQIANKIKRIIVAPIALVDNIDGLLKPKLLNVLTKTPPKPQHAPESIGSSKISFLFILFSVFKNSIEIICN